MHEEAIRAIDHAALALVQTLDRYGEPLTPYLAPDHLAALRHEVVNLRRVLLGLEMGALYPGWQVPDSVLTTVVEGQRLPVEAEVEAVNTRMGGDGYAGW